MIRSRCLWRDSRGATAVEFALLAPVLLAFIFMVIEGSRMLWTQQALQEVASATARCSALVTCATPSTFATARLQDWGIGAAPTLDPIGNRCQGSIDGSSVTIRLPFSIAVSGLFPGAPATLSASACFPSIA